MTKSWSFYHVIISRIFFYFVKKNRVNQIFWHMFCFITAARACELHGSNLAFSFWLKMLSQTWHPCFCFLDMVTLFSICFFRCDHPGDNRHYQPVLIFLRSSIFEPCHATFNWKRPILAETPSKLWNLKFEAFFWGIWRALHFSDRNLNLKESKFVTFKKW